MRDASPNRAVTLLDYLTILRRRAWVVALPLIIAPAIAVSFSLAQHPLYRADAEAFVQRASIVSSITNVDPTSGDPARFLTTQSDIARSPELIRRVIAASGVTGMSAGRLLAQSSVKARPDADVLDLSVTASKPGDAARLVNAYVQQFADFKTELDTARVNEAITSLKTRIASLNARGVPTTSPSYATLLDYLGRLETVGKLLADNTKVLRLADGATQTQPRPTRNGILSGLLGLVIGIALAFLAEALDRRVRSEHEIEEALHVPLLARVPKPPRRLRKANELVMLAEPMSQQAESFRKLRTNIEFLNLERNAKTIMVTSAVEREGKSTTVANLAVALARAGRHVALVDLDLRRPFLNRFFHLASGPGLTDVALKRVPLLEALRAVALTSMEESPVRVPRANGRRSARPARTSAANGRSNAQGMLSLLPAGTIPPAPGEFVHNEGIAAVLEKLAERFDLVLIDAPPLLAVGDAMVLSSKVDAVFAVARLGVVQRPMLHELARQLQNCPAETLGFVVTGAERGESYEYAYAYSYTHAEGRRSAEPVG